MEHVVWDKADAADWSDAQLRGGGEGIFTEAYGVEKSAVSEQLHRLRAGKSCGS